MKINKLISPKHIVELYKRCSFSLLVEEDTDKQGFLFDGYDTTGDLNVDYPIFMLSLTKNKVNPASLTVYSLQEYKDKRAKLFKLKGVDAGFAIAADGDIISVHNSDSKVKNIGKLLISLAKQEGGTKLDHFDLEPLNRLYGGAGFKEYDRYSWDDQFAPTNWNYEKFGTPDLVLRRL